ncbi:MAG: major facilitator superfamily 1 [Clostridia bacterium]|nr:major facilitator superfamily 1 [Clostridia bacterium]
MGSFAASMIFKFVPYPTNYGIIFVIVFILLMVSYYFMSNVYELPTQVKKIRQTGYFSRIKEISTVAIILGKAGFSFQVIYAKVKLGISSEQAAFIATGIFISQTAGYIFWSYINTKFNYKKSIEMSSLLFIPAIVAMLLMDNIFMLYVSVALFGFAQSARNSGENNLVIAICPREQDKPAYVGLRNTLLGPFFAFVPLLAGVAADIFNYEIMFMGSIIFVVIGYILMKFFVKLEK